MLRPSPSWRVSATTAGEEWPSTYTNGQEVSGMFQRKFFHASMKKLDVLGIICAEQRTRQRRGHGPTTRRMTKHMVRFIAPTRAGATPRKVFGAAGRAKTWGRSRPWQCFLRVLQRVCWSVHVAVGTVDGLADALNRKMKRVLNWAKQSGSGHYDSLRRERRHPTMWSTLVVETGLIAERRVPATRR